MKKQLYSRLSQSPVTPQAVDNKWRHLTPAAVLVPLYIKQGEPYVLLTQRTDKVRDHKGQISFPGGKFEGGDHTLETTALRETHEEVGLVPKDVEIWGYFEALPTITDYYVFPYVGCFEYPYPLEPNPDEIATLIEVPLAHLQNPRFQRTGKRTYAGQEYTLYYYDYQEWTIWGITGQLIHNFLKLLE